ncbi:MAG: hypothetical protein R6U89_07300 [Dehalococcoidia bacterium]
MNMENYEIRFNSGRMPLGLTILMGIATASDDIELKHTVFAEMLKASVWNVFSSSGMVPLGNILC